MGNSCGNCIGHNGELDKASGDCHSGGVERRVVCVVGDVSGRGGDRDGGGR